MHKTVSFLSALAVFLGTVIGVGIFSLPYVALKAGFFVLFLYFLFMGFFAIIIHSIYGEICLGTRDNLRFPGQVEAYLGKNWKKVSFFTACLGITGALLAYLIVGGDFLTSFFAPYFGGGTVFYTVLFFLLGSWFIFRDIKSISFIEISLLVAFFGILFVFLAKAAPLIDVRHFSGVDLNFLTFPYGVVLFSLWGTSIIPEIEEVLGEHRSLLKKVLATGIIISAITYLLFVLAIFGVSGPETSKEAMAGVADALGNTVKFGFIFGVIACFTSYISLGLTLKKIFIYDFKIPSSLSLAITCLVPLALFLLGFREYIDIIGLTGAVTLGIEGAFIVFIYKVFLKQKLSRKMNPVFYLLPFIFALGVAFEIFYFVKK